MALKQIGYLMQLSGFIAALLTGFVADSVSAMAVIIGIFISCMFIVLGKFFVGYAIYLKQEREEKMITRYRNKKSA